MTNRRFRLEHLRILIAVLGCFVWAGLPGAWCQKGLGQEADPAPLEQRRAMTPQRRSELYQQLRRRAELLEAQSDVVKLAAKLAGPTVVHIDTREAQDVKLAVGPLQHFGEAGAGVIIEREGKHYVLTNAHLIHGAQPDEVRMSLADGRPVQAARVWEDAATDVAVLSIGGDGQIEAAPLGNSDTLEVGEYVLAVGSPFGFSHTVTNGIISAKGRRDLDLSAWGVRYQDFLQTDAAINPGNSGGPLLNLRGEVIGINTAFVTNSGGSEGLGFAIPINTFMRVATQLIDRGQVRRARIGVDLDPTFTPSKVAQLGLPRRMGALVSGVAPHSAASNARLQPGDVILDYDHTPVQDESHLVTLVGLTDVGKSITLRLFRHGEVVQARLVLTAAGDFTNLAARTEPAPYLRRSAEAERVRAGGL